MDHDMPGHDMPGHDMPGHDMPATCKMSMLFTWDYQDACVVFKWWHIKSLTSFILSMIAIAILSSGYEYFKYKQRLFVHSHKTIKGLPGSDYANRTPKNLKIQNSIFYGIQVGYSFMLMLVFMTYNGWLMIAVVVGAAFGHFLWGSLDFERLSNCSQESLDDSLACH